MMTKWITTTAVALVIGTGAVMAQSDMQKKGGEEGTRAQTPSESTRGQAPSKDAERSGAGEQRTGDHTKGRAEQGESKGGAKESQRGDTGPGERSKQAQEPSRESKEPARQQSQDQTGRDRSGATQHTQDEQKGRATQHTQDEQKGRDTKQSTESKQPDQQRPENRAGDEKKPADAKQQQGQRQDQQQRDRDQASQPSGTSTQQSGRPGETRQDQRQGQQQTGPMRDQSAERSGSSRLSVNDDQRRQMVDRLRSDRSAVSQNVNVRVDIGARLPTSVRLRPLPGDIVRIAPQYRDYEYTVIEDRVAIVDPRSHEVIDVIEEGGGGRTASGSGYSRERISFSGEERQLLREHARRTVGATSASGTSGSTCLSLQPVPEELARNHPELSNYKYLAIGDEAVLIDTQQQKIVQVID